MQSIKELVESRQLNHPETNLNGSSCNRRNIAIVSSSSANIQSLTLPNYSADILTLSPSAATNDRPRPPRRRTINRFSPGPARYILFRESLLFRSLRSGTGRVDENYNAKLLSLLGKIFGCCYSLCVWKNDTNKMMPEIWYRNFLYVLTNLFTTSTEFICGD